MIQAIAFYLFAGILSFSALFVITARNPVHSVLWLVLPSLTQPVCLSCWARSSSHF